MAVRRPRALLLGGVLLAGLALFWIFRGGGPADPGGGADRDGADAAPPAAAQAGADPAAGLARASAVLGADADGAPAAPGAAAAAADRARDLHGIVVGPDGRPYAGAEVAVILPARQGEGGLDMAVANASTAIARQQTDSAGRFSFAVEPGRRYDLDARAPGLIAPLLRNCQAGEHAILQLQLDSSLRGRVLEPDGRTPVAQARLRLFRMGGIGRNVEGSSDAAGAFVIGGLDPGEWSLEVEAAGWPEQNWQTFPVLPGAVNERDVILESGVTLRGVVVDALTRAPIAGAEISGSWVFSSIARSESDGSFALPMLKPGAWAWEYHARARGYGRRSWERAGALPEEPVIVELSAARRLSGRITGSGEPLLGAYVAAVSSESGAEGQQIDWQAVRSGRDGAFQIEDLRPDLAHALLVRHPGFGSVVYELPPEEMLQDSLDVGTVDLAPAAGISGRAVDEEGHPIAGLQLRLNGGNQDRGRWSAQRLTDLGYYVERIAARTDDLGRFAFTDLAPGTYSLTGIRQSLDVGSPVTVTVASGQQLEGVELLVAAGLKISGIVVDPDGRPVAGVRVLAYNEKSREAPALKATEADGVFVVPGLLAGEYRLEFQPRRDWDEPEQPGALFEVRLEGVAAGTENLEVRMPWLRSIRGRVVHEDGSPAQAFVGAPGSGPWTYYSTATLPDGTFALWVPDGATLELAVQARADSGNRIITDGPPHEIRVPGVVSGTQDLVVTLPRVP